MNINPNSTTSRRFGGVLAKTILGIAAASVIIGGVIYSKKHAPAAVPSTSAPASAGVCVKKNAINVLNNRLIGVENKVGEVENKVTKVETKLENSTPTVITSATDDEIMTIASAGNPATMASLLHPVKAPVLGVQPLNDEVKFAAAEFLNIYMRQHCITNESAAVMDITKDIGKKNFDPAKVNQLWVEVVAVKAVEDTRFFAKASHLLGKDAGREMKKAGHRTALETLLRYGRGVKQSWESCAPKKKSFFQIGN